MRNYSFFDLKLRTNLIKTSGKNLPVRDGLLKTAYKFEKLVTETSSKL